MRFAVDRCDMEWLEGWVDDDGPVLRATVTIGESWACDFSPCWLRADLRAAGVGDGRRAFRVRIAGYMSHGINRVGLKIGGREIFARDILVFDDEVQYEPAPVPTSRILRPREAEDIHYPRFSVITELDIVADEAICRVWELESFLGTPPDARLVLTEGSLRRASTKAGLFTGDVEVSAEGRYIISVFDQNDQPLTATLVVRRDDVRFRSEPMDNIGVASESTAVSQVDGRGWSRDSRPACSSQESVVLGPLCLAGGTFSNFTSGIEKTIDVECVTTEAETREFLHGNGLAWTEIYPDERYDASDSFIESASIGNGLAQFSELLGKIRWDSARAYFCRLPDVKLFIRSGLTVFEGQNIWRDSAIHAGGPLYLNVPGSFRHEGELYAALPPHAEISSGTAPIIIFNHHNYGHWLLNSLSAVWHANAMFGSLSRFVIPPASSDMRDSLALLGIENARIAELSGPVYGFPTAVYPSLISTHSSICPSRYNMAVLDHLNHCVDRLGITGDSPKRIFITRRGGPVSHERIIENEEALQEALIRLGFVIVRLHEYDFASEIALFRRAEIIIGQVGTGLNNLAFAPAGCFVIEISNETLYTNEFLWFATLRGHRFIRIMMPTLQSMEPYYFVIRVSVEEICSIVDWIESEQSSSVQNVGPRTFASHPHQDGTLMQNFTGTQSSSLVGPNRRLQNRFNWRYQLEMGKPPGVNLCAGAWATQSSLGAAAHTLTVEEDAASAIDGCITGSYSCHTDCEPGAWWMVDLGGLCSISEVRIFNFLAEHEVYPVHARIR